MGCVFTTEGSGASTKYYIQNGADTASKKLLGSSGWFTTSVQTLVNIGYSHQQAYIDNADGESITIDSGNRSMTLHRTGKLRVHVGQGYTADVATQYVLNGSAVTMQSGAGTSFATIDVNDGDILGFRAYYSNPGWDGYTAGFSAMGFYIE